MAQIPVAVVDEVSSISGMCPWWTVTTSPSVARRNAMKSSAPAMTVPPDAVVSTTTSSAYTCRVSSQSLVSVVRKYRAFNCLIASMSSTGQVSVVRGES